LLPALRLLEADEETQEWLRSCKPNICTSLLASVLNIFFSVTDTNAILRRGQMFVLSDRAIRTLLGGASGSDTEAGDRPGASTALVRSPHATPHSLPPDTRGLPPLRLGRLLDVGAGDGGVTALLQPHFQEVHATEVSRPMARRLRERGYTVHETPYLTEEAFPHSHSYDVVSILNVLDRCDHPGSMLSSARRLLKPDGRLLLAVVLPFSEFVEEGTVRRRVHGPLPMRGARCGDGASFEASLSALVKRAIVPAGFELLSVSKVPYLCRGDMRRAYYVLTDAIIVCKPALATGRGSHGTGAFGTGAGVAVGTSSASGPGSGATTGAGQQDRLDGPRQLDMGSSTSTLGAEMARASALLSVPFSVRDAPSSSGGSGAFRAGSGSAKPTASVGGGEKRE
jgi:SAM-dependent methyltransferase